MKVSLFEQVPYRYMPEGFENQHNSVVTAPYQVVERRADDRIPVLRLRGADACDAGRLRRDRGRPSTASPRTTSRRNPNLMAVRRRLRRAGRGARRGDHRARPLARQDARAAEDRRGVRAARLHQRRPADRRLPGRAQLRREPERVPARDRDPRALPRAPRADPEGVVRAAALPVERPLREVRPGEHLAAAGPAAASADLDPGHAARPGRCGTSCSRTTSSCT